MRRRILALVAGFASAIVLLAGAARAEFEARMDRLMRQEAFREALDLAGTTAEAERRTSGENSAPHLTALLYRANMLVLLSRPAEAGRAYDDVLERSRAAPKSDAGFLATTLSNMAVQRGRAGHVDEAGRLAREAVALAEGLDDTNRHRHILIDTLMNLGVILRYQSQSQAALSIFGRTLRLARSTGADRTKIAEILQNLASAREELGDWKQARADLMQAFEINARVLPADHSILAALQARIGLNFYLQRQFREARSHFRGAYLRQARSRRMPAITRAAILSDHGKNELELRQYGEARRLFSRALDIRREILSEQHPDIAHTMSDLAEVDFREGRLAVALEGARAASNATIAAGRTDIRSALAFHRHVRVLWAQVQNTRKDKDRADALAREAFRIAQFASRSDTSRTISRMALRMSATDERIAALLRVRDDAENEVPDLEAQLSAALSLPAGERRETYERVRRRLQTVESELASARRQLGVISPTLADVAGATPLDVEEAAKILGPDQVLVSTLVSYSETFVWAVTRENTIFARTPISYTDMGLYVNELRRGLTISFTRDLVPVTGSPEYNLLMAHDLYAKIFGGISAALRNKTHLLFVPDGPLTALPPHVLVRSSPSAPKSLSHPAAIYREADWLARSHAISIVPSVLSLQALAPAAPAPSATAMIGFGDPIFDAEFVSSRKSGDELCSPVTLHPNIGASFSNTGRASRAMTEQLKSLCQLPETRSELQDVARTLGNSSTMLKFGGDAREGFFKQANLKNFGIVYFATHALVAGELGAGEPGIVLTVPDAPDEVDDGFLGASEIALKELNADWVVLSACNTAAGSGTDPGGLSGLARAFFHAGARALLVSHWSVNTFAAEFLSSQTFRALGADPEGGKAGALRTAMELLITAPSSPWQAHPAYWAPFVVVESGTR